MTEVTRVPLQPIAKGSLTKLWLGVIVALLVAAGVAWAAVPAGVKVTELTAGKGPTPEIGDVVFVKYTGMLDDGTEFDKWKPEPIPPGIFPEGSIFLLEEGQLVPGFRQGLQEMQEGGKYRLEIPSELAYGDSATPTIPANSDLTFEVELMGFMSMEDAQAKMMAVQQAMQAQQQAQGGQSPGGDAPSTPQQAAPPTAPQN